MGKKLIVILFGIVAIGVGIFLLISGNDMEKRCTAEATGTIIQIIEEKEENINTDGADIYTYTYFPVIEYKAGENTISQKYSNGSGNMNKYKVGDKIDILYDSNKPEDYLIKGDKSSSIMGIIFIIAGAIVTLIGVVKKQF